MPSPKGGEAPFLLMGAVHGVLEARKEAVLLLSVSTLQTFLCAASSSQGSLCQSSPEKRSTKSEAVPAEGVARLTLCRPEAQKGDSHKKHL